MMHRTYTELSRIHDFKERFEYLALHGAVGRDTFGFDRWMNQAFYTSKEWRDLRHVVIARDLGCDLGMEGHEIRSRIYVHHMNPLTPEQIDRGESEMLDPEFLICVTLRTHNAVHFGNANLLRKTEPTVRTPGDTKLW